MIIRASGSQLRDRARVREGVVPEASGPAMGACCCWSEPTAVAVPESEESEEPSPGIILILSEAKAATENGVGKLTNFSYLTLTSTLF